MLNARRFITRSDWDERLITGEKRMERAYWVFFILSAIYFVALALGDYYLAG